MRKFQLCTVTLERKETPWNNGREQRDYKSVKQL